ncbi:Nn.00g063050.m01.CDS01 [Neocucurbitaria sp. VM-36]
MSLLRTLDRTSAVSNTPHARPLLSFLYPALEPKSSRRSFSKSAINPAPRATTPRTCRDTWFIHALVRAGSCHEHARQHSTLRDVAPRPWSHCKLRRKSTWPKHHASEWDAGAPQPKGPFVKVKSFAEKELRALVDYYGMDLDTQPAEEPQDEGNLVWNVGDTHEPWPLRDGADAVHIARLEELLKDEEAPHDHVFDTYKKLQSPGVVYLCTHTIRALLRHLSIVERPSPVALQRFLSILDDMKTAHIHIIRSEWTSAIHLAGHAMGPVSVDDLQSALYIWRDMEHRAGVKGGFVTLNVLFNVAVKAGKYSLAETFLKELQARKLPLHRHFRVSLLYYHGVRQDGNSVRRTYQELVAAGDIVDTVVMNAVIASLIRAGEPSAAEHVFERMKRLHAQKAAPAPGHTFFNRNWRHKRLLALHLTHEARRLSDMKDHEELKKLQDFAPIAPDSRTYALLVRHHATTEGNIDRVNELLREMRYNSVLLEGTIFIVIFHGFNSFGGVRYTSWTPDKLEKIWTQYLKALNEQIERTWLSSMSVIAALKAFSRCTDAERTLKAWEEIRMLWQPNEEELENVMRALRKLVPSHAHGFFDENPDRTT